MPQTLSDPLMSLLTPIDVCYVDSRILDPARCPYSPTTLPYPRRSTLAAYFFSKALQPCISGK